MKHFKRFNPIEVIFSLILLFFAGQTQYIQAAMPEFTAEELEFFKTTVDPKAVAKEEADLKRAIEDSKQAASATWICQNCTYENTQDKVKCEMCGADQPAAAKKSIPKAIKATPIVAIKQAPNTGGAVSDSTSDEDVMKLFATVAFEPGTGSAANPTIFEDRQVSTVMVKQINVLYQAEEMPGGHELAHVYNERGLCGYYALYNAYKAADIIAIQVAQGAGNLNDILKDALNDRHAFEQEVLKPQATVERRREYADEIKALVMSNDASAAIDMDDPANAILAAASDPLATDTELYNNIELGEMQKIIKENQQFLSIITIRENIDGSVDQSNDDFSANVNYLNIPEKVRQLKAGTIDSMPFVILSGGHWLAAALMRGSDGGALELFVFDSFNQPLVDRPWVAHLISAINEEVPRAAAFASPVLAKRLAGGGDQPKIDQAKKVATVTITQPIQPPVTQKPDTMCRNMSAVAGVAAVAIIASYLKYGVLPS